MAEEKLPTALGSVVLVRTISGGEMPLMLRPRSRRPSRRTGEPGGGIGWHNPHGDPWVGLIVQDHLIRVVYEAPEGLLWQRGI